MLFKLRYFLTHLLLSVSLAACALLVVFYLWYPSALAYAVGVTKIFITLLVVDVILGPVLTFVVSSEGKKSLKFDIGVIVVLQLSAFAYGIHSVALGRPVWMVFNVDRFDLVQAYQISDEYRAQARPEYQQLSWFGPKQVASAKPKDEAAQQHLLFESVMGGADLPLRPDLYEPIENELAQIKASVLSLSNLQRYNDKTEVEQVLEKWPEADGYLPMNTKLNPVTVLIQKTTGKVLGIVALKPWG